MRYNALMQIVAHQLVRLPVLSLQTGQPIALTTGLLLESGKLELKAFICQAGSGELLLLPADVKQIGGQGILVDSEESLAEIDDIVRLKALVENPFVLIGLPVVTELGRRIGKVETFTLDPDDYRVQKLHIHRPLWHLSGHAIIDRTQVVDVSHQHIVVKDTDIPAAKLSGSAVVEARRTPGRVITRLIRPESGESDRSESPGADSTR